MKTLLLFFGMLTLIGSNCTAQSLTPTVISSQGDYFTSSDGSISWTLGEIMTETFTSTNIVTQGFQQPHLFIATAIPAIESATKGTIYPNPAISNINIEVNSKSELIIYDMLSQQIERKTLVAGLNQIDVSQFPGGMYIATIINLENNIAQSYKISKTK